MGFDNLKLNISVKVGSQEVETESPLRIGPREGAKIICFVGAEELPEFLRQSELLKAWRSEGAHVESLEGDGKNHLTVVELLADKDSLLTKVLLK